MAANTEAPPHGRSRRAANKACVMCGAVKPRDPKYFATYPDSGRHTLRYAPACLVCLPIPHGTNFRRSGLNVPARPRDGQGRRQPHHRPAPMDALFERIIDELSVIYGPYRQWSREAHAAFTARLAQTHKVKLPAPPAPSPRALPFDPAHPLFRAPLNPAAS